MRKQNVHIFLPTELLAEIDAEAKRQSRSRSWLLIAAWKLARRELQALPVPKEVDQ